MNTQFGYYTLRNEKIDIVWYTHSRTYKYVSFEDATVKSIVLSNKLIGGQKL